MVTDPPTNTDRTDYNTLRRSLARSVMKSLNFANIEIVSTLIVCLFVFYQDYAKTRDGFEDTMFEAKAKAKARQRRGQGQGQGQGQTTSRPRPRPRPDNLEAKAKLPRGRVEA